MGPEELSVLVNASNFVVSIYSIIKVHFDLKESYLDFPSSF